MINSPLSDTVFHTENGSIHVESVTEESRKKRWAKIQGEYAVRLT